MSFPLVGTLRAELQPALFLLPVLYQGWKKLIRTELEQTARVVLKLE